MKAEHLKKQWLSLIVGLAGALGALLIARRLWDSWPLAFLAALLGPVPVVYVGYANSSRE